MKDAKELILQLMDEGYTNNEIKDKTILNKHKKPLTLRYIQMMRTVWRKKHGLDPRRRGRTENIKLFSYNDVEYMLKFTDKAETLQSRRFKEYYQKTRLNNGLPSIRLANKVLERDDYRCQECGGFINLECHHFQNEGSFNPDDCVTLCKHCHEEK